MLLSADVERKLKPSDLSILLLVAALLFLPAVFSGRPLSVHEGRLPQLAKEMVWGHGSWLLPQSGGRPWLERPPLPHWITAVSMMFFGRVGSMWSARLPAAIAGAFIGYFAAWMSARWFGRAIGLLAGVITLSSFEIYQYATLAEDDIYLGLLAVACMAMFVRQNWSSENASPENPQRSLVNDLIGGRPLPTILFFVLLGLTNLAKGPLVGAAPIIATLFVYLIWNRDARQVRQYLWLWGWLIFIAFTLAWPMWAMKHYPDVVNNWRFDYLGQNFDGTSSTAAHQWDHPWWYYGSYLPLALAPWTPATIVGMIATARRARDEKNSPERFIWCWAIVGLLILSVPMRKHHQYLVPIIAPWAILSAIGVMQIGEAVVRRASWLTVRRGVTVIIAACVIVAATIQLTTAARDKHTMAELDFLQATKMKVPPGETVMINADIGSLEFFRVQFMLRRDQHLLQNLTYLRDPALNRPMWYVITRASDESFLKTLGSVRELANATPVKQSAKDSKDASHDLALFEVTPFASLKRISPTQPIGVLQAMGRQPGPWLEAGATTESVQ